MQFIFSFEGQNLQIMHLQGNILKYLITKEIDITWRKFKIEIDIKKKEKSSIIQILKITCY